MRASLIFAGVFLVHALQTSQGDRPKLPSVEEVSAQITTDNSSPASEHVEPPVEEGHPSIFEYIMKQFRVSSLPDTASSFVESVYNDGILGNGRAAYFAIYFFAVASGAMTPGQVALSILWIAVWSWLY